MPPADFLDLPDRSAKPRTTGLTHVLDPGAGVRTVADLLSSAAAHIDIWKVGWGTAYVDAGLDAKIALLRRQGIAVCLGGTMLEIAWAQDRAERCLAWAAGAGFDHVEVSRGTVPMSLQDKGRLIALAARRFTVLAEVGSKAPGDQQAARTWPHECLRDLDAGAALVVTEGRQSGTVGTFDSAGRVRPDVVEAVVSAVDPSRVVFEAPRSTQQAWFVRRFGPDVNLGNVGLGEVLSVETLRLGLRSDTAALPTQQSAGAGPA
ncbi:phosphosulfolactate synthase [Pseudonocardia sp. RS11V-5]|uniref:phosphosulfolactate synthase n=1 Tax=Pseudonocardia terrae TaxID=2905831 RepID=UPI001E36115A|nr:phosphosulfolactate synthase [Pseudonocardia terrae]MCE3552695.1 phosphosulfolactate synthase [Pseudonocardia terrae]